MYYIYVANLLYFAQSLVKPIQTDPGQLNEIPYRVTLE